MISFSFCFKWEQRKMAFKIYWPLASLFARPNSPLEKSLKEAKKDFLHKSSFQKRMIESDLYLLLNAFRTQSQVLSRCFKRWKKRNFMKLTFCWFYVSNEILRARRPCLFPFDSGFMTNVNTCFETTHTHTPNTKCHFGHKVPLHTPCP